MNEIKMPRLGQSVEEAEIVTWLKREGDTVREGDALFTIQTDKAEIECESTASGVLRKILVQPGVEVPVLSVVALVGTADEALPDSGSHGGGQRKVEGAAAAPKPVAIAEPGSVAENTLTTSIQTMQKQSGVSPRARKLAAEHHVNVEGVKGTGAGGRVLADDVDAYLKQLGAQRISPTAKRIAAEHGLDVRSVRGSGVGGRIMREDVMPLFKAPKSGAAETGGKGQRRVPLTPMRRIIAERMSSSKYAAPHYYVTVEIDMTGAKAFRADLKDFKASYNDLVLFATAKALIEFPAVNARWDRDAIIEQEEVNLGMAVALPAGLIVPVVRGAQGMSLKELAAETRRLADKAQQGKLLPDDYSGNTFTVSNLGAFGVDQFTAIINQPDSAILAVGRMKDKVVAIDGGIHIRPMMNMTLSSDHRVIDGAVAARFMGRLRELMELAEF